MALIVLHTFRVVAKIKQNLNRKHFQQCLKKSKYSNYEREGIQNHSEIQHHIGQSEGPSLKKKNQPINNAVLRGQLIAIQSYRKKQEKSQINNLPLHLRQLGGKKVCRRTETIKIMAEIREMNKTIAKINENKGWF